MKKIKFMSMMMLAMIVLPFMVSCSKDDDSDKNSEGYRENDYGSMQGKTFTVVDIFVSFLDLSTPTKVTIYSFSAGTGTRHTYEWEYSSDDNPSFYDGKYYFPQLDQDFTELYSYGNHHLFTDKGVEYFTYSYSSEKNLYRIDMGYEEKYPYEYFRLEFDGIHYTVKVFDAFGDEYSSKTTYSQELDYYKYSSSGGNENDGSGGSNNEPTEEWVKVSADGYMPYWYCPTGNLSISSTKRYTSNIDAYKNTKTGAYKVRWAGAEYTAHKGNNKITLDTDPHSVYNERYEYWSSHTDYYYYEFTIYD